MPETHDQEPQQKTILLAERNKIKSFNEGTKTRKSTKTSKLKDRYHRKILAASDVITAVIMNGGNCNDEVIDTVLASYFCGVPTVAESAKGKKALSKSKESDRDFAEMAFSAASQINKLGGGIERMYYAAASILACRGQKKYRKLPISEYQLKKLSESVAQEAMMS